MGINSLGYVAWVVVVVVCIVENLPKQVTPLTVLYITQQCSHRYVPICSSTGLVYQRSSLPVVLLKL
jgi:hypothetical protein